MPESLHPEVGRTHRSSPDHEFRGWPLGIKYIVGNEGCERFSFYGMKAILFVYLAALYQYSGLDEKIAGDTATLHVHLFMAATYGFSLIGAVLAEKVLGKYLTIFWLSLVYCAGHAVLSLFENNVTGIVVGLALIAVGAGGIKPCVSAHVGDQFGRNNWFRLQRVFQLFYFLINFGSFFSTLCIPLVKEHYGYSVAFAIPGILMAIATLFFWMGRKVFIHVPAKPGGRLGVLDAVVGTMLAIALLVPLLLWDLVSPSLWASVSVACLLAGLFVFRLRQSISLDDGFLAVVLTSIVGLFRGKNRNASDGDKGGELKRHWFFGAAARRFGEEAAEGPLAVFRILVIFAFVSVFWALFDQHASSWIRQAGMMDREVTVPLFGSMTLLPEQISALNPLIVMMLIPMVSFGLYPAMARCGLNMTPLRRMTIGMVVTACAFVAVALIQTSIAASAALGDGVMFFPHLVVAPPPSVPVTWQIVPYVIITLGEVMVSITGLEFAYSQAPRRMKSIIMSCWMLTVTFGNVLVAGVVSKFPALSLTMFFWVFAALMAAAAVVFALLSIFVYQYKDYPQE